MNSEKEHNEAHLLNEKCRHSVGKQCRFNNGRECTNFCFSIVENSMIYEQRD